MDSTKDFQRLLLGPGPSNVEPDVLNALSLPTIGHLDPRFLEILNETRKLLQYVFRTKNEMTLAISGTGSAGMEACVANLVETGDSVLICVNGVFGMRMADVASRYGADVDTLEIEWGEVFAPEQIAEAMKKKKYKVVGIVNAETSTGAHQPLEEIAGVVHEYGALFLVDAVTSLGGMELNVDDWEIDACYSGTQKCLSCPPGLAPVTFSPRAMEKIEKRKSKVGSWYLDLTMIRKYWGSERLYHHTAPINMNYALLEALKIIRKEGLENRWKRHFRNHLILKAGLQALGIDYVAQEGHRLPMLNAVAVPEGVDDFSVRKQLLEKFKIEIGGGLGKFKGKAWRIGLMGASSTEENVFRFLEALEFCLRDQGMKFSPGIALNEAQKESEKLKANDKVGLL